MVFIISIDFNFDSKFINKQNYKFNSYISEAIQFQKENGDLNKKIDGYTKLIEEKEKIIKEYKQNFEKSEYENKDKDNIIHLLRNQIIKNDKNGLDNVNNEEIKNLKIIIQNLKNEIDNLKNEIKSNK